MNQTQVKFPDIVAILVDEFYDLKMDQSRRAIYLNMVDSIEAAGIKVPQQAGLNFRDNGVEMFVNGVNYTVKRKRQNEDGAK